MTNREALINASWLAWRRFPPAKDWGRALLKEWIQWHMSNGFLHFVMEDDDHVAGLLIARTLMKVEDWNDCYATDPEGSVIFIDLAISLVPQAAVVFGFQLLKRYGERETVAWHHDGKVSQFSGKKMRRLILRKLPCGLTRRKLYG